MDFSLFVKSLTQDEREQLTTALGFAKEAVSAVPNERKLDEWKTGSKIQAMRWFKDRTGYGIKLTKIAFESQCGEG